MFIDKIPSSRGATLALFLAALLSIAGCGGGSPTPTAAVGPAPPTGGGGSAAAGVISVTAGQTTSGVDINVSAPASSPPPNAELLGVTDINSGGSASNSGASIHRGSNMKVLLFGAGLSGAMTVIISGPGDISVSNIRSITSTSGTAGVAFDAAVSSGAALGARTVYLKSPNGDITTFTGGLEVIP